MKLLLQQIFLMTVLFTLSTSLSAQKMPDEYYFSDDGHILHIGRNNPGKFYDVGSLQEIRITFPQSNYLYQLDNNYDSQTNLLGHILINGEALDSTGIRYKGMTSYMMAQGNKKSFNINLDFVKSNQDYMGYSTLNLNNSFNDPSFMREVFYYYNLRRFSISAKANFVHLYVNDNDYGIYQNIQQYNKDFLEEWFVSNDGSNWRADVPAGNTGGGGGGFGGGGFGGGGWGPTWGDGSAAFNYLGDDTASYQEYYDLKSSDQKNPWNDLPTVCRILEQSPVSTLEQDVAPYLDIDRVLWHLAAEVLFADDDSYIYKGKMDYMLYQDAETGRFITYDYDGNSIMADGHEQWSPFYNETNDNYPLMNKLLAVPTLRQRYLAHLRTLIVQIYDENSSSQILNNFKELIDPIVQSDPIKEVNYSEFTAGVEDLKDFIRDRKAYLLQNEEVSAAAPVITNTGPSVNGTLWKRPAEDENVVVTTEVSHNNGIANVYLYYGTDIFGTFTKTEMFDDGQHEDGNAGDGKYGATIPPHQGNTIIRFYVEATAANNARTASYSPVGAEHDVYVYRVKVTSLGLANAPVVINEFMARNESMHQDEAGEYNDWIELHNKTSETVDLSGYYLTDNSNWLQKWQFQEGVTIAPKGYLIIWADEDASQGATHANFKLSAAGEEIILLNENMQILDSISFGEQFLNGSYARIPNATGSLVYQSSTFSKNNNDETVTNTKDIFHTETLLVMPNPANSMVTIKSIGLEENPVVITSSTGKVMYENTIVTSRSIDISDWTAGIYIIKSGGKAFKLVKN